MSTGRILELLAGTEFVDRLFVADSVTSTNDEVRRLAAGGAPGLTTVIADHQSAGRGRLSRPWHSPRGLGLYVSVLFRPAGPSAEVTRWTVAAAVAACRACRSICGREIGIKWPNDLVYEGRKLAGTLAEMRSTAAGVIELVVGTGFNVHQEPSDFPGELRAGATSLRIVCGPEGLERERLAAAYLEQLADLGAELAKNDWPLVADEWTRLAAPDLGRRVRIVSEGKASRSHEGVTRGLDSTGALIVDLDDGSQMTVHLNDSVVPLE